MSDAYGRAREDDSLARCDRDRLVADRVGAEGESFLLRGALGDLYDAAIACGVAEQLPVAMERARRALRRGGG